MSGPPTIRPCSDALYRSHADGTGRDVPWPEFHAWAADPRRIHIVSTFERPGVIPFLAELEARLFPADSLLESAYYCHSVVWMHIPWNIASVPGRSLDMVQAIASEIGLLIRNTVPVVCETPDRIVIASLAIGKAVDPEFQWFPLKIPTVYTIEHRPPGPANPPRGAWG